MTPRLPFAVAAIFALLVAGCGSGKGFAERRAEGRAASGNVFRYPIVTVPTSLDPGKTQDGDTLDVVQQVFEGLVKWGEDNTVQPNLATGWTVKDDGRTYVFSLKPGVKFSNGREMTAEDVKWSFERSADPRFGSPTAETYMTDIVGVREKLAGKAQEIAGVKALDPKTVSITIDKPRPYFLGKMTYACMYVVAKEAVGGDPTTEMTRVEQMIGTGPFKVQTADTNRVILAANGGYHGGAPKLERIERPVVKDANTRLNLYRNGEVDLVPLERQDIAAVQADPKLKNDLKLYDRPSVWYVGISTTLTPELRDPRVRRALAMAIDRKRIVEQVLGGANKLADGIVPPGVFGYQNGAAKTLPYDVAAAKALLAQAGFPEGRGFPTVEMSFRDGRPDASLVAQAVQQQWKENLGVTINLQPREWGSYLKLNNAKKLPLFHMRWAADYLDAENFLSTLLASYGNENKVNYRNAQYDALCRKGDTSLDPAVRKAAYAEAENIALNDAAFIPIYFQRDAELIRPTIKGMRDSLFGHLPHTTTSLR